MNLFIAAGSFIGGLFRKLGGEGPHDPRGMLDEAWREKSVLHRIGEINYRRAKLGKLIAQAKRRHEKRSHLYAEMQSLTTEKLRLESFWEKAG